MKEVLISLGSDYFYASQHSGFSLMDSVRELIDNSNAAGATDVRISVQVQPNNKFTVLFYDNGCGMTQIELEKGISVLGSKKDSENNHYGMGLKQALFAMCKDGNITIKTTKNSVQTIAKLSTVKSGSPKWQIDAPKRVNLNNGTLIEVTNVDILHGATYEPAEFKKRLTEIYMDMSVRYYPKFEQTQNYKLYVPDPETYGTTVKQVIFQDPLYREMFNNIKEDDDKPWVKRVIEKCLVDGKEILIEGYAYIKDNFNSDFDRFGPVEWDKSRGERKRGNCFTKEKSGVYLQSGSRFAFLGNEWFISNTQHDTNNLRIFIKIPDDLIPCFLLTNKSQPNKNDVRLQQVKTAIKLIIDWHRKENCTSAIGKGRRTPQTVPDTLTAGTNDIIETHGGSRITDNPNIRDLIPESTENVTPNRNDFVKILRSSKGKNSEYYEASRKDRTLIITLNEEHPWVYKFFDNADDTQKQNLMALLYSRHYALLKASVAENMKPRYINRIIQEESNELREFYQTEE